MPLTINLLAFHCDSFQQSQQFVLQAQNQDITLSGFLNGVLFFSKLESSLLNLHRSFSKGSQNQAHSE